MLLGEFQVHSDGPTFNENKLIITSGDEYGRVAYYNILTKYLPPVCHIGMSFFSELHTVSQFLRVITVLRIVAPKDPK